MLIYGIIFPRWRVAADVSLGSWKIFRRFFPSLFRPIIASAGRKCYTAPAIIPLLFLSPSLISFKSSFGHSHLFSGVDSPGPPCYAYTWTMYLKWRPMRFPDGGGYAPEPFLPHTADAADLSGAVIYWVVRFLFWTFVHQQSPAFEFEPYRGHHHGCVCGMSFWADHGVRRF